MILLLIDTLYSIHNTNINQVEEKLIQIFNKFSQESQTLWIIGYIGVHFSTQCIKYFLEKFLNSFHLEKLPIFNPTSIQEEEITKISQTFQIQSTIKILEFLSKKTNNTFENLLVSTLEQEKEQKIENLCKILFFLPKTIIHCCRCIVLFIKNEILPKIQEKGNENFISFLFLRIFCFQAQILQFLQSCLFQFPDSILQKYHQFLQDSFEFLHQNQMKKQNEKVKKRSWVCFDKHIFHLRCCIIPFCKIISLKENKTTLKKQISLCYLQIICIYTNECSALDVLFHIFMNLSPSTDSSDDFSIFIQLLEFSHAHYPEIKKKFIDRLISYFPFANSSDLPHALENLVFLSILEQKNQVEKKNSLIQFLANEIHFELLFSFFKNQDFMVRVLAFQLLEGILCWLDRDPIVVFLLVQKLFSSLFIYMEKRYHSMNHHHSHLHLSSHPDSKENILWMITHISFLSKFTFFFHPLMQKQIKKVCKRKNIWPEIMKNNLLPATKSF